MGHEFSATTEERRAVLRGQSENLTWEELALEVERFNSAFAEMLSEAVQRKQRYKEDCEPAGCGA